MDQDAFIRFAEGIVMNMQDIVDLDYEDIMDHDDEDDVSLMNSDHDREDGNAAAVEPQEEQEEGRPQNQGDDEGWDEHNQKFAVAAPSFDVPFPTVEDFKGQRCKMYQLDPDSVPESWRSCVKNAIRCKNQRDKQKQQAASPECGKLCRMSDAEVEYLKSLNIQLQHAHQ